MVVVATMTDGDSCGGCGGSDGGGSDGGRSSDGGGSGGVYWRWGW